MNLHAVYHSSRSTATRQQAGVGFLGHGRPAGEGGSVLIIVLWIALGLVTVALYFANSMTFELRASDNRVAGLASEQAIDGAARYVAAVLALQTNGTTPDVSSYQCQAVPVGEARFWLIGRRGDYQMQPDEVFFGLVDEGSKLNLNVVSATMLSRLTNMTDELAANITDWCSTNLTASANGDGDSVYTMFQPAYFCKHAPFDTVEELRLVYPLNESDLSPLFGEDSNCNGVLDPSETDTNRNNSVDSGLLEYFTVYTREPNTLTNGESRVDVSSVSSSSSELISLLQTNLTSDRFNAVATSLNLVATRAPQQGGGRGGMGGPGGGGSVQVVVTRQFPSPLAFYVASGMTADEFALIANSITVTNGDYIVGRVNINTAPTAVLACLPGVTADVAQQLVAYRQQNTDKLGSIAWVVEALGQSNASALTELQAGDYITTQSYQFTADVAAIGPHGRGYRRVKFVFDTSTGTPQIVYRRDLSHLGWALGRYVREDWLLAKDKP